MKKIYMILAAITLLSMSLNAQLLPDNKLGGFDFTPTGTAYHKAPNGQFRMPSLASDEYLLGPYITDDFDETGATMANVYTDAQWVRATVRLLQSEYQDHIGDTIIGFRFALAGSNSVNVQDFGIYPASQGWYSNDQRTIWNLGELVGGNISSTTQTQTTSTDVTFDESTEYGSTSISKNGITISTTSGNLAQSYYYYLLNRNSRTTISTNSGTITKIVITGTSTTYPVSRLSASTGSYTTSNNVGTWTGNASSVVFTASNTVRCTPIVVTVETTTTTTVNTVEVGNGNTHDEELPAYGYWHDRGYKNQMIYRAEQLSMASGASIRSLTFYPEDGIPFAGSTVTVSLANTSDYNFGTASYGDMITSGLTTVATFTPAEDHDATAWTINFDTPFTYTGGNLVVQVACPGYVNDHTNGQFGHCYFLGDNQSSNVSIKVSGKSAANAVYGPTSKFLPKATFGFTGNVNEPSSMTLQGGQWHDFFLDEPVVFEFTGDSIISMNIGYTYYQLKDASFAPVAYNSNSTGHANHFYMYARANSNESYSQRWWGVGSLVPGDLAAQLIFKKAKEKTPTPTITVSTPNGQYVVVTATADPSTPNAQVTLSVNGQTVTGTGTVQIILGQTDTDYTVTAVATAQETGMLVSDPASETFTVTASWLDPSPTPTITSQLLDLSVQVTGNGQGTVHMYVDGQEVTYPDYYLERGDQEYTVTVTITAQTEDHRMTTTTETVVVPPLSNIEQLTNGWTQLPGTYTDSKVINWNDYVMFVDRFTASTANNNQPTKYTYVMTENDTKLIRPLRETNEHIIPVQTTSSKVFGYFTEAEVLADVDRKHVDLDVMNADVQMYLEKNSDIYYYTLDRSRNSILDDYFLELSNLQYDGAKYVEFDEYFVDQEPLNIGETGINIHRFDTINAMLPATAPQGDEGKHYGNYDDKDYIAYVPIIWTFGNHEVNERAFWDRDHKHNSYGSPIWKTSVGKVELIGKPQLERQEGKNGSTNWMEDDVACSIFMITDIHAKGFLPDPTVSNIKYEPYMFRVWIESNKALLRNFEWVEGDPDDLDNRPGTHFKGRGIIPAGEPYLVWEEMISDNTTNIYDGETSDVIGFHKLKVTETETVDGDVHWTAPQEINMLFAAPDTLKSKDVKIYVRFYYRSTGTGLYQNDGQSNGMFLLGNRDGGENGYYGVEGDGDPDDEIPTFIQGVYTNNSHGEIVSVTYYNAQGMKSNKPFDGINIIVTRYSDGTSSTTKVMH